jgi:hypothetical protein
LNLHKKQITAHLRVQRRSDDEPQGEDLRFGTMPEPPPTPSLLLKADSVSEGRAAINPFTGNQQKAGRDTGTRGSSI